MNTPLTVHPARIESADGNTLVSAEVEWGERRDSIFLRAHGIETAPRVPGDAFLAGCLIAAMIENRPLRLSDPVSAELLSATETIQAVMRHWYPELSRVPIEAPILRPADPFPVPGAAAKRPAAHFFSGGVDSFESVSRHRDQLGALVFVDGYDLPPENTALRAEVLASLQSAAREMGLPLVHVETNFRIWSREFGFHGNHFVGSRLAFVAHLLSGEFRHWIVASSSTARLEPFYSHPWLDPLWGSSAAEIAHPVPVISRAAKLREVVALGFPLRYLRVCMIGQSYNCGQCPKCSRTLLGLRLFGAIEQAATFARIPGVEETFSILETAEEEPNNELVFLDEYAELGREMGADPSLLAGIGASAAVLRSRVFWDTVVKAGEAIEVRPQWERIPFSRRRVLFRQLLERNPEWLPKEVKRSPGRWREPIFEILWRTDRPWLLRQVRKVLAAGWRARLGHWLRRG